MRETERKEKKRKGSGEERKQKTRHVRKGKERKGVTTE